jgi:D-aminopeptidase
MRRRQFLSSATAGGLYATSHYLPLISSADAAVPGTVTWGGAYLLDETTTDMPHTKAALAMNASSSPTGQSVNKALLDAIRAADWTKAGIDLRAVMVWSSACHAKACCRAAIARRRTRPHSTCD